MTNAGNGPLGAVRILDFTRVLSGPFATALLADLGADVLKVEPPQGDDYRHIGPFRDGESALFQLMNRNKQSLCLDLKQPGARALVQRLARTADVVVENFRPGVAQRLGIGYQALRSDNARLIYASISGFGQDGPDRDRPAFDLVAQALSGLMAMTGDPAGPPTKVGESIGDLAAGLYCSWAILAALYDRERTGRGRYIDVALVDSLVSLLPTAMAQWMFGLRPTRTGNRHPLSTPFAAYPARDGYLVICVLNAAQFAGLAQCVGAPELAQDPRYSSDELRTQHEPVLSRIIETWLAPRSVASAVAALSAAGVPAAPVTDPDQVFAGDYVRARATTSNIRHPRLGTIATMEQPVHFSDLARGRQRPAPELGVDGEQVIARWLTVSATEARTLMAGSEPQSP
jgi:CoA:oxalate CoA-transferase